MRSERHSLPVGLRAMAAIAGLFFLLPLAGLILRTPWSVLLDQLGSPEVLSALWLSIRCSVAAAGLAVLFGLPLATWLAGAPSWPRTVTRVLVTLPMVLPPVVGGVALLLAFGRNGVLGVPLASLFGITLPFSTTSVILAEAYVATPFFVLTAESGLRTVDPRYADAAETLGATPWQVFRRVTLPMIAPSLRAGLLIAWARALGEFGATITFAGNLSGHTRTMPLAVYSALESSPEAAIVLSLILVAFSAGVLFALRRHWFPAR